MYLIYFDESKHEPGVYNQYHIGAVCIHENDLDAIEQEIAELSNLVFGSPLLSGDTEFHAAELYHRKKKFRFINDIGIRLKILEDVLLILSKPEVNLIDIQINVDLLNSRFSGHDPSDVAFMFLCERSDQFCQSKRSKGMLIGDRESDRVSERVCKSLSEYRLSGTGFAFGQNIDNLVDSVHFTHSHLSRFLQLADTYCWYKQFFDRNRTSTHPIHLSTLEIRTSGRADLSPKKYKTWPRY